jgi:hypothetical protein
VSLGLLEDSTASANAKGKEGARRVSQAAAKVAASVVPPPLAPELELEPAD